MASIVGLEVEGLVDMVSIDGDSVGVVVGVEIFDGLARELVSKFSYWILFVDFSFSLKLEDLVNLTSYSTITRLVVEFKTLILLLSLS